MLGLTITDNGLEKITYLEIREILKSKADIHDTAVVFKAKNKEDIFRLNSEARSARRVLLLIGEYSLKNFKCVCTDSEKFINKFSFKEFISKKTTFRVICERFGDHNFTSSDVEKETGKYIIKKIEKEMDFTPKVSLKNPDIIIFCYIYGKKGYIGIDFSGKDISKRDYKLQSPQATIRGNIAYALLRFSGYDKNKIMADPFSGSGTIPIEAAVFDPGKSNIHCIDSSLRNIKYCKNNAAIAGVNKLINFSKTSVDWLDTKFSEGEVDLIVTYPPQFSKKNPEKNIEKLYDEFLYNSNYILSKKGFLVCLMINKDIFLELAEKHNFKLKKEIKIRTGELEYSALKLEKKSS